MKIAMLTTNMARGGAETLVALLSIELRRRGHTVDIVSMIEPTAFQNELAAAGVGLHAPGIAGIPLVLRKLRPQVLHCHMFHANICGRLLRTILPFPVLISTLHSIAETKRGSTQIRWRDLAYKLTNALADRTVAVSQSVAERHRAVANAIVIPNGIDCTIFRPDPERRARTRAELGLGAEFVWLAAGRLIWKKNFAALLKAFPDTAGITLLLAGTGPEEAELRRIAGSNVRFLGARSDIPALMNAADAFVLSSVVEGMPLVLLEAAASGLPCVATDAGGVRETGVAMVTDDLAGAIAQVSAMTEDQRHTMGQAARQIAESRYSLPAITTQWEALYRELTAST